MQRTKAINTLTAGVSAVGDGKDRRQMRVWQNEDGTYQVVGKRYDTPFRAVALTRPKLDSLMASETYQIGWEHVTVETPVNREEPVIAYAMAGEAEAGMVLGGVDVIAGYNRWDYSNERYTFNTDPAMNLTWHDKDRAIRMMRVSCEGIVPGTTGGTSINCCRATVLEVQEVGWAIRRAVGRAINDLCHTPDAVTPGFLPIFQQMVTLTRNDQEPSDAMIEQWYAVVGKRTFRTLPSDQLYLFHNAIGESTGRYAAEAIGAARKAVNHAALAVTVEKLTRATLATIAGIAPPLAESDVTRKMVESLGDELEQMSNAKVAQCAHETVRVTILNCFAPLV